MGRKKCLVIGGNGFVGSYLVDSLAQGGYEVYVFDRYSGAIKHTSNPRVHVIKADIFDTPFLTSYIQKVQYVFHCFSATTPASSDDDPYSDIEKNLLNNVKIFEACAKQGAEKLIYISSGGTIYGGEGGKEDDAIFPISPYAIGKFASERYLAYFKKKYGLKYVVYRLSNPYGPGQVTKHNQGVIPRFIYNINHNLPITVYGDGTSSRDYIYVEDAANMIVEAFPKENAHETYNLGSGKQVTLHEIISTLESIFDKKVEVNYLPNLDTYLHKAPLDTSRFEEEFNISAEMALHSGLSQVIASSDLAS